MSQTEFNANLAGCSYCLKCNLTGVRAISLYCTAAKVLLAAGILHHLDRTNAILPLMKGIKTDVMGVPWTPDRLVREVKCLNRRVSALRDW